ncbi:hypothetical protein Cci01nite_67540 [Catellatospora citrea]|uniref:Uncharacterized protein n=2 Tax=Catellatospora citrea TaxID=53366 RepID=A0A8J3P4X1_9ACTN|nr:hypothetical protein C8E86_8093 [Catellatospora citrea]GIG01661.1 hypothetical protein Cci01nite_67540 [Catellatospora citrea]
MALPDYPARMNTLAERELDPVPFLVLGLILLVLGLVMLWRGIALRRMHRGQDPRPAEGRDPRDWLRILIEGLLLTGVGLAFAVHAASRLLN